MSQEVTVSCGYCDWDCRGTLSKTFIATMKHYGSRHGIQGWFFRRYQSLRGREYERFYKSRVSKTPEEDPRESNE